MKGFFAGLRLMCTCAVITAGPISCRANDDRGSLPNAPTSEPASVGLIPDSAVSVAERANFLRAMRGLGTDGKDERSAVLRPTKSEPPRFWGRENAFLFSLVGASRALDYASTLNMRRRGRDEALLTNDVVDNHAAFAAIEAGGTAVSIGASYLFHRYHRHRLERWTSIIHASLATTGAVRNYCLKTAHPSTVP